jgi:aminoglycoside phosphotransferase (APT) family kinase protein
VSREARLLTVVADFSPLPVPVPAFAAPDDGCLAYFKIPGQPLLDAPTAVRLTHAGTVAATVGRLLAALHAIPVERFDRLVGLDDLPLLQWRDEAAAQYPSVRALVPAGYRPEVEAFLRADPPGDDHPLVFSHNDLGIEHILVDPGSGTVTGVIDWGDAAIVDPAYDLGLLLRDLGPDALAAALREYGDDAPAERALFYARCSFFEDLGYGQDRYVDKSVAALPWLFG